MIKILRKKDDNNSLIAREFLSLYNKIIGENAEEIYSDDGKSDLVVIGKESASLFDETITSKLADDSDDYIVRSVSIGKRRLLIMAGGRIRSCFYALYDYFEKYMNCRWFWDGDITPLAKELTMDNVNIYKTFKFKIRGQRYFAHRGLHRFQAEHWDIEDWKKEIDWMLKKKLNMFMLRIGQDDIFQKAFPDIVDYPDHSKHWDANKPDYFDRTTAWSLEYRGNLRKMILDYAFERDLIHCEDCGTMTHWYSQTPQDFLDKVKPRFAFDASEIGGVLESSLAWDIDIPENMEYYWKLTDAHIKHYGRAELFHTIGFAERVSSKDHYEDIKAKIKVFKDTENYLKKHYPGTHLLIASWDFWISFNNEDVKKLVAELDPEVSIIFDYTSDSNREKNFTNWGVVGKFPYIFGIFHAYSRNSEIRGYYNNTEERLKIAAGDDKCIGCVMWPETVHTDTFMTEYFTANACEPLSLSVGERLMKFCEDRYTTQSDIMKSLWQKFFPLANLMSWSMDDSCENPKELFFLPLQMIDFAVSRKTTYLTDFRYEQAYKLIPDIIDALNLIKQIELDNEFIKRDIYDITRTIVSRYIHYSLVCFMDELRLWKTQGKSNNEKVSFYIEIASELLNILADVLGSHDDYLLSLSLKKLSENRSINPYFEVALKKNTGCEYHRSFMYENVKMLYIPELELVSEWTRKNLLENNRTEFLYSDEFIKLGNKIKEEYNKKPFSDFKKLENITIASLCDKTKACLDKLKNA